MIFRAAILITFIVSLLPQLSAPACAEAFAPLNIYVVRHGETLGNTTGNHSTENDRTFSKKGEQQVAELTQKLERTRFDRILVSPKYRAMNTIFPYLKKNNLKAEIWPELDECCWQKKKDSNYAFRIERGEMIRLESAMRPYFIFPDKESERVYMPTSFSDGVLMIFKSSDRVIRTFGGSGKNILIVTHYHSGGRLLEILQGLEPEGRFQLSNAKIAHLRETSQGTYRLLGINQ
ncbi:phosphoglycerate mutase family protein [Mariprofundus sp. KV]|uniref:histidine phosphatase family protein n=1 Tax=Mariprofundus sp. KV TaxID=2608715 RepID=UPI0015A1B38E|nr:phosphoglycerate mutase family protein [Mariprofundus sp. KV]NWF37343.1 histidine phosphatase family protein [Mariprofundus sp. KV]